MTRVHLTERECEVLERLADGDTDQQIADRLGITISTVQSHLDRVRDKTGARRRAELTRLSLEYREHPEHRECRMVSPPQRFGRP